MRRGEVLASGHADVPPRRVASYPGKQLLRSTSWGRSWNACMVMAATSRFTWPPASGGAFLSMTVSKNVSVGASGAIFGDCRRHARHRLRSSRRDSAAMGPRFRAGNYPFHRPGSGSQGFWNMASTIGATWVDWPRVRCWRSSFRLPGAILPYGEIAEPPSQALVALPVAVVILAMAATANHYRTMQAMDRLMAQGEATESAQQYDREFRSFQQALRLAPREEQPHEEMGSVLPEAEEIRPGHPGVSGSDSPDRGR